MNPPNKLSDEECIQRVLRYLADNPRCIRADVIKSTGVNGDRIKLLLKAGKLPGYPAPMTHSQSAKRSGWKMSGMFTISGGF